MSKQIIKKKGHEGLFFHIHTQLLRGCIGIELYFCGFFTVENLFCLLFPVKISLIIKCTKA